VGNIFAMKIPLFRVSRIQVYAHFTFLAFAGWQLWKYWDTPGWAILFIVALWGSILLHEFGHCAGARFQGGDAREILLWPLGGLATCDAPMTPWAQGFVAAAGPAVNVVIFSVAWALGHVLPEFHEGMYHVVGFSPKDVTDLLVGVNVFMFLFNVLLPAFPMDASRILQAILWIWMGFQRSMRAVCYVSFVAAGGLLVWTIANNQLLPASIGIAIGPTVTLVLIVFLVQEAYNQLQLVNAGYFEDLDEPWRQTFRYHSSSEPRSKEPGLVARWLAERERAKVEREAQRTEARAARLDDVLRRVAQVGMDGLSAEERVFLEQESARLRDKR
jgi:Zn-dependent protease